MRPIRRGPSPQTEDFSNYRDALPFLVRRLGPYCSYCERRVATQLAVEHIQPKGLPAYHHLIGWWNGFLLACVNCNSTKGDEDVDLAEILLPDRDNTFVAFAYTPDGAVRPASHLSEHLQNVAARTLSLIGLDRRPNPVFDENGRYVALDRVSQRMEAWLVAAEARADVEANPENETVRRLAVQTAQASGFFSIWMTVFEQDSDMRNRLIDSFAGTRGSECFASETSQPRSPAPNPDRLSQGSKV